MNKYQKRYRRAQKTRSKIKTLDIVRLCVTRSHNHIYAQLISPSQAHVLASASTLEKACWEGSKRGNGGNQEAAARVGKLIAERAHKANIKKVAFDRSGYRYHGRVRALAQAAREAGIEF